jgi:hypothetical protein
LTIKDIVVDTGLITVNITGREPEIFIFAVPEINGFLPN